MHSYQKINGKIEPLKNDVLVYEMEKGEKIKNGIIHIDDNGKDSGIRPRWAKVYKVGSEVDYLKENEWILVPHGRWTYAVDFTDENNNNINLQKVDTKDILMVSSEKPF